MEHFELRYSDLTPEEKAFLGNGCGGKGHPIDPPEFFFHASCNQHDFYYWRGGTAKDRKNADSEFYKFMRKDAREQKWYKVPFAYTMATIYFMFVRMKGKKYFNYTDTPKTRGDLEREMNA